MSRFQSIAYSRIPRLVEPVIRLLDNPLLIAQARRQLRRKEVTGVLTVIGLGGTCLILLGISASSESGWAAIQFLLLSAIAILLLLRAASTLAMVMAQDRLSGILDFHRATPTSSWTDALGYLLGTPAREYVAAAAILPFLVVATLAAGHSVLNLIVFIAMLLLNGLFNQTAALLSALTANGKRRLSSSVAVVGVILPLLAWPLYKAGLVTAAYLSPLPMTISLIEGFDTPQEARFAVDFFGISFHPVLFTVLVQGSMLAFLVWGVARRLSGEAVPTFSRVGALLFFAVLNVLVIGGSWGALTRPFDGTEGTAAVPAVVGVLSGLYLAGATIIVLALIVSLTPSYLEFLRALRRSKRLGRQTPHWTEDGARAWPTLPLFFLMVLGGFGLMMLAASQYTDVEKLTTVATPLALSGSFTMMIFGTGMLEYVRLAGRKSVRSSMMVIFLTCILPWMVSGLLASFGATEVAPYVASLSPVFGSVGSISLMAATLMSDHSEDVPNICLVISQVVAVGMGAWFYLQSQPLTTAADSTTKSGTEPAQL